MAYHNISSLSKSFNEMEANPAMSICTSYGYFNSDVDDVNCVFFQHQKKVKKSSRMNVGVYGATENKLFLLQKVILFFEKYFWQYLAKQGGDREKQSRRSNQAYFARIPMSVCVCVCACVRACECVCVRVCIDREVDAKKS